MIKMKGFTLVELMLTLAIAAILIGMVAPGLLKMILDSRLGSLHNSLISDLALARNTSVNSGNNVVVCASNNSQTNCNNSNSWANGWLVFEDIDNNERVSASETIIVANSPLQDSLRIKGGLRKVKFSPEGTAVGYSTVFTFCDSRGKSAQRGLNLSNSGRARVADANEIIRAC